MLNFKPFKLLLPVLFTLPWIMGTTGGCPNVAQPFANTTTDAALLFQAQQQINAGNYTTAITTLSGMTSSGLAAHDGAVMLSTAYAGVCGLNVLTLATALSGMGSTTLFSELEIVYASATAATVTACKTAETTMMALSSSVLTSDDYVFLAFIELAKIGNILIVDGVKTSSPAYACNTMASADVQQVGSGITIAYNSLLASGSAVGAVLSTPMTALCTTIAAAPLNDGAFCSNEVAANFTNAEVQIIETLIMANEIGVNSCGGSSYTGSCHCP